MSADHNLAVLLADEVGVITSYSIHYTKLYDLLKGTERPMDLGKITATLVNTAIDIYLQLAYGDAETREQHSLYFQEDTPLEQVLTSYNFV